MPVTRNRGLQISLLEHLDENVLCGVILCYKKFHKIRFKQFQNISNYFK